MEISTNNPLQKTAHKFGSRTGNYPLGQNGIRNRGLKRVFDAGGYDGDGGAVEFLDGKDKIKIDDDRGNDIYSKENTDVLICDNPESGCGRQLEIVEEHAAEGWQLWRCPAGYPDYYIRYRPKKKEKTKPEKKVVVGLDGELHEEENNDENYNN